jgi:chloramphenicol O-acetyltransferase type A
MRLIELDHPHRRAHFEYFRDMNHPHFSVCAPVDVTALRRAQRAQGWPLTPLIVHTLSAAANAIPELRWRIRGEQIVEHELVHPSFAVGTEGADVFSFCEVRFSPDREDFMARARVEIERMRRAPVFADEPGRDDYLFLSALPWVSFTGITHAMPYHPHDSVPRITWGRLEETDGRVQMPVAIQAHHALADGRHIGRFFERLEAESKQTPAGQGADGCPRS